MCGRGAQRSDPHRIARAFGVSAPLPNLRARYNAAPLQEIGVARWDGEAGRRTLTPMTWGLVPSWSKTEKASFNTINARCETVEASPAYRAAWKAGRRCLVPFDVFFEWKKLDAPTGEAGKIKSVGAAAGAQRDKAAKQPYAIGLKSGELLGLAGLWERKGELLSFTIITCAPNALTSQVHDRMPVIVPPARYGEWLGEPDLSMDASPAARRAGISPADARAMLEPYVASEMTMWPVDARVGNWRNDDEAIAAPIGPAIEVA